MNRLWIRLSLAFTAVILVGFAIISAIGVTIIRANFEEIKAMREAAGTDRMIEAIAPDQVTSLDEVVPVVINGITVAYVDAPRAIQLAVVAINRVLENTRVSNEPPVPEAPLFPIAGPTIRVLTGEQFLLIVAAVVSTIGVLFGVLMSRTLAAPLNTLAVTADAIGAGDWKRRVHVKGTVETLSLAQSFNKMVDQLQHNEELRRNLIADVAHELRTPITALQANIYAILDDAYPLTKDEIAGLYEQIRLLSRLVTDLHELSQADAGVLPLYLKPLDFSQTLGELIAPFHTVAESKGVRLDTNIPAQLPLVCVDEERINQVLHNLLNNALRYTPEGGIISIAVKSTAETVCLEVRDTGTGIAPEHLPNVFERFYRADYARSRKTGGMGLGLAIAKAIVEAHHGKISASSSGIAGEGATFTIELPIIDGVATVTNQP